MHGRINRGLGKFYLFKSNLELHDTTNGGIYFFDKSDQDALNATIEAYQEKISYLGKEGMGFEFKHITMYHALGSPKPWKAQHISRAFKGRTPRKEDVVYWENAKSPILAHPKGAIAIKKMSIKVSKLIGRFYKV